MTTLHYKNPPITEAIIDIRASIQAENLNECFDAFYAAIQEIYPGKNPVFEGSFYIQEGEELKDVQLTADEHRVGYRYQNSEGTQLVQASIQGLSVHRLKPYQDWDTLWEETQRLWYIYKNIFQPTQINRAGVRYINRIELPGPIVDFKRYLRTFPEISAGLPQGVTGFLMQFRSPHPDIGAVLVLTEVFETPSSPAIIPVILDIELSREYSWDIADEQSVWKCFEDLHDRKNLVFTQCITEDTERLFNQ